MGLVAGIVVLNGLLAAVGFCLLSPALRGRSLLVHATYAGVALLVGAGAIGVALSILATLEIRLDVRAFLVVSALLAAAGVAAGRLRENVLGRADADPQPPGPPRRAGEVIVVVATFAIAAVLLIAVVGGFRSSPWLDDTWYFWLPKGRALDLVGLDARLWRPDPRLHMLFGNDYETLSFIRPDNPLWWSIVLNLDVRFVGRIDLRAVNAELAFLLIGFVTTAVRLLWGRVRPSILLPALLVVLSAPELLRQTQSGAADVPLAIYLALAMLAAAGWLALGSRFAMALFVVFASTAIAIKSEGVIELLLALAILSVAGRRERPRLALLWGAAAGAVATSLPWFAWRATHDIANVFSVRNLFSPSYLGDHTDLLHGGIRILGDHFTSLREWSLIVPLTIALGVLGFLRDRRFAWIAPATFLGASYVLFDWISWADPEGAFRLLASAYRYVTPPIVLAGVFLPVVAERLVGRR